MAVGHFVATCCDMLGVVGSNLKMVKFFMQHLWMLHDVVVVWPVSSSNVPLGMRNNSIFHMFQHVATGWPNACNMLRPTMLRSVAFKCCRCLAGACKCWANNVGICCVEMLLSFGRGLMSMLIKLVFMLCVKCIVADLTTLGLFESVRECSLSCLIGRSESQQSRTVFFNWYLLLLTRWKCLRACESKQRSFK